MSDPRPEPCDSPKSGAGARHAAILIVDDDGPMALGLKKLVERDGHVADTASSAEEAFELLQSGSYGLVLSDVRMPGASGLDLLEHVKRLEPTLPVVLLTGHATIASAVAAIRAGAFDYLPKPFKLDEVRIVVQRALERKSLVDEVSFLRREVVRRYSFGEVVAGAAMQAALDMAQRVAPASSSVLVSGETGTGKELVAKAIHFASARAERPFLAVNCAALSASLIESELFGHARGAFTGAVETKSGYFQVADGGTLFLDEIGEISLEIQVKLLRVLQEGVFQRVGDTRSRSTDVRVVAATNRDLEDEMRRGRFREDLYYRLAVVNIRLPALRERREDIPALARHFLARFAREFGKPVRDIDAETLARLQAYQWPGNVRELENAIERGVLLAEDEYLASDALPGASAASTRAGDGGGALVTLEENEKAHLLRVLRETENNKNVASRILGITRRSLYRKLEKHGLKT